MTAQDGEHYVYPCPDVYPYIAGGVGCELLADHGGQHANFTYDAPSTVVWSSLDTGPLTRADRDRREYAERRNFATRIDRYVGSYTPAVIASTAEARWEESDRHSEARSGGDAIRRRFATWEHYQEPGPFDVADLRHGHVYGERSTAGG